MASFIHSILIAAVLILGSQASALTPEEFVSAFVKATNARLVEVNAERAALKKHTYCKKLNPAQVSLIKEVMKQSDITVGEFVAEVTETLECYPPFWAPWQRKHMAGTLFNTKAYIMDNYLVRDVLVDLNYGISPSDDDLLIPVPFKF